MVTFEFVRKGIHPTDVEETYLSSMYSRFFNIYDKFVANTFWSEEPSQRLFLVKEMFSVYNECSKYEPINEFIKSGEFATISNPFVKSLFTNLRHILSHFPLTESWGEVKFKKSWLTVFEKNSRIEKFMTEYKGWKHDIEFRIPFEPRQETLSIRIPDKFFNDELVSLEEIITEKSGIAFSVSIMALVLGNQLKVNRIIFH